MFSKQFLFKSHRTSNVGVFIPFQCTVFGQVIKQKMSPIYFELMKNIRQLKTLVIVSKLLDKIINFLSSQSFNQKDLWHTRNALD